MFNEQLPTVSFADAAARINSAAHIDYQPPLGKEVQRLVESGKLDGVHTSKFRATRTQILAWAVLHSWKSIPVVYGKDTTDALEIQRVIGLIGAKGSAKTHLGSAFAMDRGQVFPGSLGGVISNTYQQAKDNAGKTLVKRAKELGFNIEFFDRVKIRGEQMTQAFVIDLDGTGFRSGQNFYVLVRTFDQVNNLEGIELDWGWIEEIQHAERDDVATFISRIRGHGADQSLYIAGMTDDEEHFMYDLIPALGAIPENDIREMIGLMPFDPEQELDEHGEGFLYDIGKAGTISGAFFEPVIFENQKNLPSTTIPRYFRLYDAKTARRLIFAQRTTNSAGKVVHAYESRLHKHSEMAIALQGYDPALPLRVYLDFNVYPMSAGLFQLKKWEDEYGEYEVLVQVDEIEVWKGGTEGMMKEIISRYGPNGHNHEGEFRITGDASAQRQDTRANESDWQIITRMISAVWKEADIRPGTLLSHQKDGSVKWINPPRRDTYNVLNAALVDGLGRIRMVMLTESPLRSGGIAAAFAAIKMRPDGNIDTSNEKKEGRDVVRSHFFDVGRYAAFDTFGEEILGENEHEDTDAPTDLGIIVGTDHSGSYGERQSLTNLSPFSM